MAKLTEKQLQQPVSVKFPVEVRIELEEAVQRSGLNRNQFISQSVAYFLRNVDPSNTEIQRRSPETSLEASTTGGVDEQARKYCAVLFGRLQSVEKMMNDMQANIDLVQDNYKTDFLAFKELYEQISQWKTTMKIGEDQPVNITPTVPEKLHEAMKTAKNNPNPNKDPLLAELDELADQIKA